jgi:hypothetical protein
MAIAEPMMPPDVSNGSLYFPLVLAGSFPPGVTVCYSAAFRPDNAAAAFTPHLCTAGW